MEKKAKKEAPLWPLLAAAILLIAGGLGVFLYPTIMNYMAEHRQTAVIQSYSQKTATVNVKALEQEWLNARNYNDTLSGKPSVLPFSSTKNYVRSEHYMSVLNPAGDGMMGYLSIPKINVRMPIYHGCDEQILQKGIGHVEQTHLPIGGEGTHAVLSGHRGLATAEMFTRLDELEPGDQFYLYILDATLAYEVDEINVVEPQDLELINAVPGEDLTTLVTCTPYGINTHRLLVRGHRIEYVEPENADKRPEVHLVVHGITEQIRRWLILVGTAVAVFAAGILLSGGKRRKKNGNNGTKENDQA